ncbi:MAG: tRNA dihydrouridine(20/20a) synthase DusA [Gammaproteobacteria bacterium]|nr:tRNA dihydrouridine(20/20a) synthase DusA [Gammaproteobacteria bacterium]OUV74891.1 MAG: tRNA dihydrouridine(20/20a) synthase DusA [Gammaproteobacteria bacterium TMED139]
MISRRFCIAPMMDWTDRHDRVFLRKFSKQILLYTEMVTSAALQHGDANYLLKHNHEEHPVALQIGGSSLAELAYGAKLGEKAGFDEINLNVGCPSDRVKAGSFGACLMAKPKLVADCVDAMANAVEVPVTVKCRTGIDDLDSQSRLLEFIATVSSAGCRTFIIHARKAILSGLSPKENREIPPLHYGRVLSVKENFPELEIVINGGITTFSDANCFLRTVDGVMIGREAYQNPFFLAKVDEYFFNSPAIRKERAEYLEEYIPYIESELKKGTPLKHMTRHLLGLFKGQKGGKQFRRHLSENAHRENAGIEVIADALKFTA